MSDQLSFNFDDPDDQPPQPPHPVAPQAAPPAPLDEPDPRQVDDPPVEPPAPEPPPAPALVPTPRLTRPEMYAPPRTPAARADANIAALQLQAQLEPGAELTDVQRRTLAKWSGWGALPNLFQKDSDALPRQTRDVAEILSKEEWDSAMASTINAHYTSPDIAKAMWAAAIDLGFAGGKVLEPGCGHGAFLAAAPDHLDVDLIGVEKDPRTASIASLLHPDATIHNKPFQSFNESGFDLVIGNVPFANIRPYDRIYNPEPELSLHNYFISKSLALTRPGGLAIVITSTYTLDAQTHDARRAIASRARLLGAVRLHNQTFADHSGTHVTTDILVLQRRERDIPMPTQADIDAGRLKAYEGHYWVNDYYEAAGINWVNTGNFNNQHRVNSHYVEHPHRVLGEFTHENSLYGRSLGVRPDHRDSDTLIAETLTEITSTAQPAPLPPIIRSITAPGPHHSEAALPLSVYSPPRGQDWPRWAKDGSILFADPASGTEFVRLVNNEYLAYQPRPKAETRELRAIMRVRDAALTLIDAEAADLPDAQLDELRGELNRVYDAYVERFGWINRGQRLLEADDTALKVRMGGFARADPDYSAVVSLENYDPETDVAAKAAIFDQRIVRAPLKALVVDSLSDALVSSLHTHGRVDLDFMASITSDEWEPDQLLNDGLCFHDPESQEWTPTPLYLSGNVRTKLDAAIDAASTDPSYQANVEALTNVLPDTLTPPEITVKLGVTWLTPDEIRDFVVHLMPQTHLKQVSTTYSPVTGWEFDATTADYGRNTRWGTNRMDAMQIITAGLRNKPIRIVDRIDKKPIVNQIATEAANEKLGLINDELHKWCFYDNPDRCTEILDRYQRLFCSNVTFAPPTEWVNPPGLRAGIELYDHQKEAIARVLFGGDLLLGHAVGAGKTLVMAAAAIELKRLGLVNKPVIVVPNHLVEQIAGDIRDAYPQSRVLVPNSSETTAKSRKELFNRCRTDDWDAIVISTTAFSRQPVHPEVESKYIHDELESFRHSLMNATESGQPPRRVKEIARMIERYEEKLKANLDIEVDEGDYWESSGIDFLLVDEAHHFKNLTIVSNTPDLGFPNGSQKAMNLDMKIRWLREQYPQAAANVLLSTGTPIANKISELWVMQRYIQPEALRAAGVYDFDAWAATFAATTVSLEMSPTGGFDLKTRVSDYQNVPELHALLSASADLRTADALNLDVPDLKGDRPEVVQVPETHALVQFIESLDMRRKRLGAVEPHVDNMLKITSEGRRSALDLRLIDIPQDQPNKTIIAADRITAIHEQNAQRVFPGSDRAGALQVVFCDQGVPSADRPFSVYNELRRELMERGVPRDSIAFIHDIPATSRAEFFSRCRDGSVSVLIGSTEKMGTGMNVQTRLAALHHLDAPWRPGDISQREGRILRQGNQCPEIEILRYVTKRSFDSYVWQTLERKSKFINKIMDRTPPSERTYESIENNETINFEEAKAVATGNPLIVELNQRNLELAKLQRRAKAHADEQSRLTKTVDTLKTRIPSDTSRLRTLRELPESPDKLNYLTEHGSLLNQTDANAFLLENRDSFRVSAFRTHKPIGTFNGLGLTVCYHVGRGYDDNYHEFTLAELITVNVAEDDQAPLIATRLHSAHKRIAERIGYLEQSLKRDAAQLENAQPQIGTTFVDADEITVIELRINEIKKLLDIPPPTQSLDGPEIS